MDGTIGESGWWDIVWGWSVGLSRPSWRFGLLQHGFQSLLPVLAAEVQGGSGGGAVKKGIGRPFGRCRVVRCGDRLNGCRCVDEPQVSTDVANGYRHVAPAGAPDRAHGRGCLPAPARRGGPPGSRHQSEMLGPNRPGSVARRTRSSFPSGGRRRASAGMPPRRLDAVLIGWLTGVKSALLQH